MKKYVYILVIIAVLLVSLNIVQYNHNNHLKAELGRYYDKIFFYTNKTLNDIQSIINDSGFDREAAIGYRYKIMTLQPMMGDLPLYSSDFVLRSIEYNLRMACILESKGMNYEQEYKEIEKLTELMDVVYEKAVEKCSDDYLLWYKHFHSRDNTFIRELGDYIIKNYEEIVPPQQ